MQKLDLRNDIKEVLNSLRSKQITDSMDEGNQIDSRSLLQLFIESKAGFDKAVLNPQKDAIFKQLKAHNYYETGYFSQLIAFVSPARKVNANEYLQNLVFSRFISFHKSIQFTFDLIDSLLFTNRDIFGKDDTFDSGELPSKGILMLQIIDDGDPTINKVVTVIQSIQDLLKTIYLFLEKVHGENFEELPKVILVDSGSDINITFKLPEKAAEIVAGLLKEFWDLIVNGKYTRHKKNIDMVESSIDVLKKIKDAETSKVIDRESAEIWRRGIIENTETVLLNNTLTKAIIVQQTEISNRELLLKQSRQYQLTEGKKDGDSSQILE
ncbi:MAG: hypothetical protein ACYC09_14745 [Bacteroidota bacterium]